MSTSKDTHTQHISQQFNSELIELKSRLLVMGGMVEQQVQDAIEALISSNTELADSVRAKDKEVDKIELAIDEEATRIIAKRQPAASDLRLVVSIIKMVADLERIGDEAKKIAKFALALAEEGQAPRGYIEVRHIGTHVGSMVRDALDAFARFDTRVALAVMREDDAVDNEYRSATRALVTFMMEDPRSISRCLNVMWVLRALERVGDHANNLAEHVIFMVEGKDVRHAPMEVAEEAVKRRR